MTFNALHYRNSLNGGKRRFEGCDDIGSPFKKTNNGSTTCSKYYQKSKVIKTPNIVIDQALTNSNNIELVKLFKEVLSESKSTIDYINPRSVDLVNINQIINEVDDKPTILFLFKTTDIYSLHCFESLLNNYRNQINILSLTPYFEYFNEYNFPIILDKDGLITKKLNLRCPVGGGIYPISSILIFSRNYKEILRIKLGYDYNKYYDSTDSNNIETVILNVIDYTLTI